MPLQLNSPPLTRFTIRLNTLSGGDRRQLSNYHSTWANLFGCTDPRLTPPYPGYVIGTRIPNALRVPGLQILFDFYDDFLWLPQTLFHRFNVSGDKITQQLEHGTHISDNSRQTSISVTRSLLNLSSGTASRLEYARYTRQESVTLGRLLLGTEEGTRVTPPPLPPIPDIDEDDEDTFRDPRR